jgi:hypothetical protein
VSRKRCSVKTEQGKFDKDGVSCYTVAKKVEMVIEKEEEL